MRWGILTNLALILFISGGLLLTVFTAALERTNIDSKIMQSEMVMDHAENLITASESSDKMWVGVRNICRTRPAYRLLLFDGDKVLLGGCNTTKSNFSEPFPANIGRKISVIGSGPFVNPFLGSILVADTSIPLKHGIRFIRIVTELQPVIYSTSWKFFFAYLLLTQAALFFLGYILFYRTVLGPIKEISTLAEKGAGWSDDIYASTSTASQGDIQRITASIRSMLQKLMNDKDQLSDLIAKLRTANTDLEAAQQGLIRSEKLAGIGRLASGLAHELGNPLQIVMGYVELLRRRSDATQNEVFDRLESELSRMNAIIRSLLEYARPERRLRTSTDVNNILNESVLLLQGRKGFRKCTFVYELTNELPRIISEPEKLKQIFVNLLFNAADALGESGGEIRLKTDFSETNLLVTISDNGHGIPSELIDRVFDPFFTTKEPGKGTGLGLAVCLGLVESIGGAIILDSTLNVGTKVTVKIPRDEAVSSKEGDIS